MTTETAVIIAAGMGTRLGDRSRMHPKGFIEIGGEAIVEQSLRRLRAAGVRRVVVVTGHLADFYEDLARRHPGTVETVHNPDYALTGSMYSLSLARARVDDDFLLLESDLLYEQRALTATLEHPAADLVLMSGRTGSGDEVWIETRDGRLLTMSKNRAEVGEVAGELVGICKISTPLFERMCDDAGRAFETRPTYCYETDCLVSVAREYPVPCHRIDDLAWTEIDNTEHLRRASESIHPRILARESGRQDERPASLRPG